MHINQHNHTRVDITLQRADEQTARHRTGTLQGRACIARLSGLGFQLTDAACTGPAVPSDTAPWAQPDGPRPTSLW
jgi:hypothetical protein